MCTLVRGFTSGSQRVAAGARPHLPEPLSTLDSHELPGIVLFVTGVQGLQMSTSVCVLKTKLTSSQLCGKCFYQLNLLLSLTVLKSKSSINLQTYTR